MRDKFSASIKGDLKQENVLDSTFNGDKKLFVKLRCDCKRLHPYQRYNTKYTARRYWVETSEKSGKLRVCYQTFDNNRNDWTSVQKSQFFPFLAIKSDGVRINIIYVNEYMHPSMIEDLIKKYSFDKQQLERLEYLKHKQSLKFREQKTWD